MKRVLITGATGFIGSRCLAPLLAAGYEVHAVCRELPAAGPADVRWHRADLLDETSARALVEQVRPSHLLHTAWYVVPGSLLTSDQNYAWVSASTSLVRHFASTGGTRVVAAGSSYEYDWTYGYCSEFRTPIAPDTVYGACKHALQTMLSAAAGPWSVSVAWPRIFFVYGPDEHPDRLVAYVVRSLLAGEPARCSRGTQIRDYLYVQDVADALVAVLDSDVQGPVNVASGVPVAVCDVVTAIAGMLERPSLLQLGAIAGYAAEKPLVVGDIGRIRRAASWQPRYTLADGLQLTIDWWRAHATCAGRS